MAKIYVLSGAPCTGKTTIIAELKKRGYSILKEGTEEIRKQFPENSQEFNHNLFEFRRKQIEEAHKQSRTFFSDRSIIDNIAFSKIYDIPIPKEFIKHSKKTNYAGVFIMERLEFYESTKTREFQREKQDLMHKTLINTYEQLNYTPILVPPKSVKERTDFILSSLDSN